MLSIEHFSKTYPGGKRAVDDLNLVVHAGEICGFIGHNGAGKTTTLRAVAGVMSYTEGTIRVDGKDLHTDPVGAKKVMAYLPDNPDLYDYMKGIDYLNFIADLYDIPGDDRTRRIARYGDDFQLTEALGSPIGSYSHGMKQKLALISALIRKPKIIIFDEATSALDSVSEKKVQEATNEMMKNCTTFLVAHRLSTIQNADRIVVMKEGHIVEMGSYEELMEKKGYFYELKSLQS